MPLPCKMFFSLIVFTLSKSYCIELSSLDQMKLSPALMVYLEVFSVWTIHSRYNQLQKKKIKQGFQSQSRSRWLRAFLPELEPEPEWQGLSRSQN